MAVRTADERGGPPASVAPGAAGSLDARERILLTAYELFRSHGVNAVGVDRIVAEARVAKTTLYRHYGSKDDLVIAVLRRHDQVWTLDWLAKEAKARGETPSAQLMAIFDAFDDWFHQATYQGCLATNTLLEIHDRSEQIRAEALARMADVRAFVRGLAQEAGVDDPDFPLRMQLLMWGAIVGAVNGHVDAARHAREIAALLLDQALRS
jgi:AcrR family transcriptional regulator